jgi:hypothetical protein
MPGGNGPRRKGHDFERAVAALFRLVYSEKLVRREDQSGHWDPRQPKRPDVGTPLQWLECHKGKRLDLKKKYAQAVRDARAAGDPRIPVAVCKEDRGETLVTLSLVDFLALTRVAVFPPDALATTIPAAQVLITNTRRVLYAKTAPTKETA